MLKIIGYDDCLTDEVMLGCLFSFTYSGLKLQKTTCHLQQHFFNIFEPNKGTKVPENHSLS
jgi:hypothetical protein